MKTKILCCVLSVMMISGLRAEGIIVGAQFKDRILPMQGDKTLAQISAGMVTDDGEWLEKDGTLWGEGGVQARYVDNGLETSGISWWGGNIVKADDGKYHAYVAWWDATARAHSYWPNSDIYHVVSDNLQGPYIRVENLGKGHNPNVFRAKDGSYVVYALINNSEAWQPWESMLIFAFRG